VHLVASLVALAAGFLVLLRQKGTPAHKRRGRIYAPTLLVTNVTALGIYRRGIFFFPHWLAIAAVIVVTAGILVAHFKIPRRAWLHVHLTCLLTSLYILVGGGVNEIFLRIDFLRGLAPTFNFPAVGLTHLAVQIFFLALIGYFNAVVLRSRTKRRARLNEPAPPRSGVAVPGQLVKPVGRLIDFCTDGRSSSPSQCQSA
jgi:uncharacterized membrane protein